MVVYHADRTSNSQTNAQELLYGASLQLEAYCNHSCEDWDGWLHAGGHQHP